MSKKKAFTLIELLVVITILIILWTIWFISFSNHLIWTRDTNRLSQIREIHAWLEVYSTKGKLLLPENSVEVRSSWSLVWYQGYMWKNNLSILEYNKWWVDPKDEQFFTYFVTWDRKDFQLMAYLEDPTNKQIVNNNNIYKNKLFPQTQAVNYAKRYPTVYWKKLWILTESWTNLPIQEVGSIVSSRFLDIATTTGSYTANFTDIDKITWTWLVLVWIKNLILWWWNITASCKDLLTMNPSVRNQDWIYYINPNEVSSFPIYCDMTTDWWGWSLFTAKAKYAYPNSWYFKVDENNKMIDFDYIRWNYVTPLWKELPLIYKPYNKKEWELLILHSNVAGPVQSERISPLIHYQTTTDFANAFSFWEKNTSWIAFWDFKVALSANWAKKITWWPWTSTPQLNHHIRWTAWRDTTVHTSLKNYMWFPANPYTWTYRIGSETFNYYALDTPWIDWRSISIWIK